MLLAGVANGQVSLSAGNVNLEPVTRLVSRELERALKTARKFQRPTGIKWRFEEKYYDVRRVAGCWLDLAGHLGSASLNPLIKDALRLHDPRLLAYAAIAALRHKMKVSRNVIKCVAESHENRNLFFTMLCEIRRQDLFPRKWQTWDAFAAANMVDWLTYPTELGREPDELEKMAAFSSKRETIYLWRFRCGKEPWYAGVSGPYELKGGPKPIHGDDTFSRFDKWDAATAEQHLEAVVETLSEWRKVKR